MPLLVFTVYHHYYLALFGNRKQMWDKLDKCTALMYEEKLNMTLK